MIDKDSRMKIDSDRIADTIFNDCTKQYTHRVLYSGIGCGIGLIGISNLLSEAQMIIVMLLVIAILKIILSLFGKDYDTKHRRFSDRSGISYETCVCSIDQISLIEVKLKMEDGTVKKFRKGDIIIEINNTLKVGEKVNLVTAKNKDDYTMQIIYEA